MKKNIFFVLILLAACSTSTPVATPAPIRLEYTASTQPWLAGLYDCAGKTMILAEQRVADNFSADADIALRLGEPVRLSTPAYQLGEEEILIIAHPRNPVPSLKREQIIGLFTGQVRNWREVGGSDLPVQVWVFSSGEDIQQIFNRNALGDASTSSLARLAVDPAQMQEAVAADPAAVGILSKRWLSEDVRILELPNDLSEALKVPVLAIAMPESREVLSSLLSCVEPAAQP